MEKTKKPALTDAYRGAKEAVSVVLTDADGNETRISLDRNTKTGEK